MLVLEGVSSYIKGFLMSEIRILHEPSRISWNVIRALNVAHMVSWYGLKLVVLQGAFSPRKRCHYTLYCGGLFAPSTSRTMYAPDWEESKFMYKNVW